MNAGKEKKEKLSLVVPAYNEEEALPIFYREARKVEEQLPQVEMEYLFVDDGSVDGTMDVIRRLHEEDSRVHYVSFSRNFGKEAAIFAGLAQARGDFLSKLCKGVTQEEFAAFFSMVGKMVDNLGDMPLEDELRLENEFEKGSVKGQ